MKPTTPRAAGVLGVVLGAFFLLTPLTGVGVATAADTAVLPQDDQPVERPRSAGRAGTAPAAKPAERAVDQNDEARREALLRTWSGGARVRIGGKLFVGEDERVGKAVAVFGRAE